MINLKSNIESELWSASNNKFKDFLEVPSAALHVCTPSQGDDSQLRDDDKEEIEVFDKISTLHAFNTVGETNGMCMKSFIASEKQIEIRKRFFTIKKVLTSFVACSEGVTA